MRARSSAGRAFRYSTGVCAGAGLVSCTTKSAVCSHSTCPGSHVVSPLQPSVRVPSEIRNPQVGTVCRPMRCSTWRPAMLAAEDLGRTRSS